MKKANRHTLPPGVWADTYCPFYDVPHMMLTSVGQFSASASTDKLIYPGLRMAYGCVCTTTGRKCVSGRRSHGLIQAAFEAACAALEGDIAHTLYGKATL